MILGEVICAQHGLTQLRIAETEKYAHVTFFFNGGREEPFPGEERRAGAVAREVATYDLKPEMSAPEVVADGSSQAIDSGKYDFVLVNFANPDMVGHTGILTAAIKAVEAVDRLPRAHHRCAARAANGALVDHRRPRQLRDDARRDTAQPHTAHTTNPVPLIVVDERYKGARSRPADACATSRRRCSRSWGCPRPPKWKATRSSDLSSSARDFSAIFFSRDTQLPPRFHEK